MCGTNKESRKIQRLVNISLQHLEIIILPQSPYMYVRHVSGRKEKNKKKKKAL